MGATSPITALGLGFLLAVGSIPGVGPLLVSRAVIAATPRQHSAIEKAPAEKIASIEEDDDDDGVILPVAPRAN